MTDLLLPIELLPPGPDDGDWDDVLRRAARVRRRRHASIVAAAAAAAVAGLASAYALGHPIIDFNSAPKGPKKIVNDFGSLEVGAPARMAPGVLPHEARRITAVRIDGKEHALWVAPTKHGGFCAQWSAALGGCRATRHGRAATHIGVSLVGTRNITGVAELSGSFFQSSVARVEVSYADGTTDGIPFVWVTQPIDAGFFLFRVPNAHRVRARRPTAVTLFDGGGHVLARERLPDIAADRPDNVVHRSPGYPALAVPAQAEWSKQRQLFDLRADDGARIGLLVAPTRGGGTCFWTNQAFGCTSPRDAARLPALPLGFQGGGRHVTLCCNVGPNVTRVEARFQDGDRIELTPREHYLVWPIPSRHFPRGHRLYELVAFDAAQQIATRRLPTNARGLYPCAKSRNYGYGVNMCP